MQGHYLPEKNAQPDGLSLTFLETKVTQNGGHKGLQMLGSGRTHRGPEEASTEGNGQSQGGISPGKGVIVN